MTTPAEVIEQCLREIYRETQHAPNLEAWGIIAKLQEAGYKIMAREPTDAMLVNAAAKIHSSTDYYEDVWRAMWDAAPFEGKPDGNHARIMDYIKKYGTDEG